MFSSEAMTQDEAWKKNYDEVMSFITENGRNLSKYNLEERRLYTWLKHQRKVMTGRSPTIESRQIPNLS